MEVCFGHALRIGAGLLATYESERRNHAWSMVGFALTIGRVMRPRNVLDAFATEQAFRLLSLWPKARDYVSQMKFKPPPRIVVFGEEAGEGAIAVRDVSINPRLAEYLDHVLLLRPDRYVAACIPAGDLEKGAEAVRTLVAGTFAA